MYRIVLLVSLALGGSLTAAQTPKLPVKKAYVVGLSQADRDDGWRWAQLQSLQDEATRHGHSMEHASAGGAATQQLKDVQALIGKRVDVLLLSPVDDAVAAQAGSLARRAGIPLFILDRPVDAKRAKAKQDYVTYIGSDYALQGQRAAQWLARKTNGRAMILELTGPPSPLTVARQQGFRSGTAKHAGMKMTASGQANTPGSPGIAEAQRLLQAHPGATVVFAHNITAATNAAQALDLLGRAPGKDVLIVTIGGSRAAMEGLMHERLGAVVDFNPRMGPLVFEAVRKYAAGQSLPERVVVPDQVYDLSTADEGMSKAHF